MTTTIATPAPPDLSRLEHEAGVEFVDGQTVEKPVSIGSSEIEAAIVTLLRTEAMKTRSVRVFTASMGYRCFADEPAKFRKPDVSVVRAERLAGADPQDGFILVPPDLAVEVISPTELAYDVANKVEDYLRAGFPLVWVVYPNTRTVSVHGPKGLVGTLHEQDEITGGAALPSFKCKVSEFFATLG